MSSVWFSLRSRFGSLRWACGYPDWALCGAKVWMSRSKSKHRLPALILRSPVCAVCLCVGLSTLLKSAAVKVLDSCLNTRPSDAVLSLVLWANRLSPHTHTQTQTEHSLPPTQSQAHTLKHLLDFYITLSLSKLQTVFTAYCTAVYS